MKIDYYCYAPEKLIEMIFDPQIHIKYPHIRDCIDCSMRFNGLKLSWDIAVRDNPWLTKDEFSRHRLQEIEQLKQVYGTEDRAVDMAVKTAFGFEEALKVFEDLGFKRKQKD